MRSASTTIPSSLEYPKCSRVTNGAADVVVLLLLQLDGFASSLLVLPHGDAEEEEEELHLDLGGTGLKT